MELKDLKMYEYLEKVDMKLATQVKEIYDLVYETINGISKSFDNYTMHDMNHGLRVATYMESLAFGIDENFEKNMSKFNPFEITLMILCSILHDIGMNISDEDRRKIKNGEIEYTDSVTYEGALNVYEDEENAIKEIIRVTHADRIKDYMYLDFGGVTLDAKLKLENKYPYSEDIISICKAHGEDYSFLKTLRNSSTKASYTYNTQYIAALLRIADYLDIDQERTPMLWFHIMGINGFSEDEWKKHFIIQNTIKLKKYIDNKMQIYFDGTSENAKIHRSYLAYIDDLKLELENADNLLNSIDADEKYRFRVATKIDDRVETKGFTFSDLRLNLDYSSITNLLMGENIYGDKRLGLREIIQNSIDACKLMEEMEETKKGIGYIKPAIEIVCSKEERTVIIKDTGIGMTMDTVRKHFLNVGKSYYMSKEFKLMNKKYAPIGHYGIGFLSCFLLSDSVIVKTKYYNEYSVNQIELLKNNEYVVTRSENSPNFIGTEIILNYDEFFEIFIDIENLIRFLEINFDTDIDINVRDTNKTHKINNVQLQCIKDKLSKSSKEFYKINCSDFSEILTGTLYFEKNDFKIQDVQVDISNILVYSPEQNKIIKKDISTLDGAYLLIVYPDITDDESISIKRKAEDFDDYYTKSKALAISKNSLKYIFIDDEHYKIFRTAIFEDDENEKVSKVRNIFNNSSLSFRSEYLWGSNTNSVLVYDNKCVKLFGINFGNNLYYSDKIDEYYDPRDFSFYYKDILISNSRGIWSLLPYKLSRIYGLVNCYKLNIVLDVSRNSIIDGYDKLNEELYNIFLRFILKNKVGNEQEERFINYLLE